MSKQLGQPGGREVESKDLNVLTEAMLPQGLANAVHRA